MIIATISLIVAIIVWFLTYKMWNIKHGNAVMGGLSYAGDISNSTFFINELVIQNLKDKELAIGEIYIRYGENIYLDLLEKDTRIDKYQLILPAFGTIILKFGPGFWYCSQNRNANVGDLIQQSHKAKIILSTNYGKIVAKSFKRLWSPEADYFKNYGTEIINIRRYYTKESSYGKNSLNTNVIDYSYYGDKTRYVVTLQSEDGKPIEYPIYFGQTQVKKIEKLHFTQDNLQSVGALSEYLENQRDAGNVEYQKLCGIIDFQTAIHKWIDKYKPWIEYKPLPESWWEYHIQDKLQTILYKISHSKKWCVIKDAIKGFRSKKDNSKTKK